MNYFVIKNIAKIVYFQALWILLIYSSQTNYDGMVIVIVFLSIYADYFIFRYSVSFVRYNLYLFGLIVTGFLIDQFFSLRGVLSWDDGWFYPPFLSGIWAMFIVYYEDYFKKFTSRKTFAFLLASVGSPFAYLSGSRLSSINFSYAMNINSALFSLAWGVFFVLSIYLYDEFVRGSKVMKN